MKLLRNLNGTLTVLAKVVYPVKYSKRRNTNTVCNTAVGTLILDDSFYRITNGRVRTMPSFGEEPLSEASVAVMTIKPLNSLSSFASRTERLLGCGSISLGTKRTTMGTAEFLSSEYLSIELTNQCFSLNIMKIKHNCEK